MIKSIRVVHHLVEVNLSYTALTSCIGSVIQCEHFRILVELVRVCESGNCLWIGSACVCHLDGATLGHFHMTTIFGLHFLIFLIFFLVLANTTI